MSFTDRPSNASVGGGALTPPPASSTDDVALAGAVTSPAGVYVNILDGVAGTLAIRTTPISLKQIFGTLTDPSVLVTTDMSKKQAPLFGMLIAANGSPNWHLTRTSLSASAYVAKFDPNTRTLAGAAGIAGNTGGTGGAARFNSPNGICFDNTGNLIVCDLNSHTIRKVTPEGVVTILCGTPGVAGNTNGTPGKINGPGQPVVDPAGNIYFTDSNNYQVRKLTPSGVLSVLAQNPACATHSGGMDGIARDSAGNIYDYHAGAIHKIAPNGVTTVLAGAVGQTGYVNGIGTAARFNAGDNLWCDLASGNLYLADSGNHVIRKITPAGVVTTVAGSGQAGSAPGQGTAASFNTPRAVCMDAQGYLFVSSFGSHIIQMISPTGLVSTIAGLANNPGSVNGVGSAARFNKPDGLVVNQTTGDIYVSESGNQTIRVIPSPHPPSQASDYSLNVSYSGAEMPEMDTGVIPAGWRVVLTSWAAQDGVNWAGFTQNTGRGPRDVYFVPCFKIVSESHGLTPLGLGDFAWGMHFAKALNPGQAPKVVLTVTINGVTTTLTPVFLRNTQGQIIGVTTVVAAALIPVAGSTGAFHIVATETLKYLKGTEIVTESLTYLDTTLTEAFAAVSPLAPVISSVRILTKAECSAPDQLTMLQQLGAPDWSITGNVLTRFTAERSAPNVFLHRWELWWEPAPAARQNVLLRNTNTKLPALTAGYAAGAAQNATLAMPAKILASGVFVDGTIKAENFDVRFNTHDAWPDGAVGRGILLLKIFDKVGNSKSSQVNPPQASLAADGMFMNVGVTAFESIPVSATTAGATNVLRAYIAGGPGPENTGGTGYPTGAMPNFVSSVKVFSENAASNAGNVANLQLSARWIHYPWNCEVDPFLNKGAAVIRYEITDKTGRIITYRYPFTVVAASIVKSCCFADGTMVATPYGDMPIESLKTGDKVYSYDFKVSKLLVAEVSGTVTKFKTTQRVVLEDSKEFQVTEDHALYTPEKEIPWSAIDPVSSQEAYGNVFNFQVQPLGVGDALFEADGLTSRIKSIHPVEGEHYVHTLSLKGEESHWFFAGGILAHNGMDGTARGEGNNSSGSSSSSGSTGNDRCCFPAGTLITMADGSTMAIETLPPDAQVLTYNVTTKLQEPATSGAVGIFQRDNMCTVSFARGRVLKVTEDHPLFTKEGWKAFNPVRSLEAYGTHAGQLAIGDFVLDTENNWMELEAWTREEGDFTTYSLMNVSPNHNFYAGGFLAHNRSDSSSRSCTTSTSSSSNSCCLRADTLVETPTGTRAIKDIRVGDQVWSCDPTKSPERVATFVDKLSISQRDHHYRLTFHDGSNLYVSNDHPLYTADGRWVSMDPATSMQVYGIKYHMDIQQLILGDSLMGFQVNKRVIGISRIQEMLPMYTFDVRDPYNTYFAGGVLVHNRHD